jgi:hypothetical protein
MKILVTATSFKTDSAGPAADNGGEIVYNPHGRLLLEDDLSSF